MNPYPSAFVGPCYGALQMSLVRHDFFVASKHPIRMNHLNATRRARNQGLLFWFGGLLALIGRLVYGVPSVSIPIHLVLMAGLMLFIWHCHRRLAREIAKGSVSGREPVSH